MEQTFIKNEESIKAKEEAAKIKMDQPKEQENFFGKSLNYLTFGLVGKDVFDSKKEEVKQQENKVMEVGISPTKEEITPLKEDVVKVEEIKQKEKPATSLYEMLEKNYFRDATPVAKEVKIEDIKTPLKESVNTFNKNEEFRGKVAASTKIEDKINVVKENKEMLEKQDVKFDDRASKLVGKVKLEGKPELQAELQNSVNKVDKALGKVEDKIIVTAEAQKKWLEKNITSPDVASQVSKFEPKSKEEKALVDSMFDPQTRAIIKLMNDINDNKKSFEDILVKEKASRGTFNVFATDKEKEAEQSIEKLNKEFDKLSDQFNARILPQIKEYGVDLKEIEQRKIAEKENQNKIEQEKIQKDLEEKLRSFGGM